MEPDGIVERLRPLLAEAYRQPAPAFHPGRDRIGVGGVCFDEREVLRALRMLLSGRISQGPEVRAFEAAFAAYVGVAHGVAVNSGSSANLLALAALVEAGDVPRGAGVIVPAATFTTVLSPILQLGLTPVVVDVDPTTYNINPAEAARAVADDVRVLMPVHTLGCPAPMQELMALAARHGLRVVEDCCEAHGARLDDRAVGSYGDLATSSFFVAHNMTTGEGGMVLTPHAGYADLLRSLREFGRGFEATGERFSYSDEILTEYDERYVFYRLGFNLRMTDVAAALGLVQLEKLDAMNRRRLDTAHFYLAKLKQFDEFLQLPSLPAGCLHSFYAFPLVVRRGAPFSRAVLARYLEGRGIETRALFGGNLVDQPAYRRLPLRVVGDLPISRWLRDGALFIGCHPGIGDAERQYVVDAIAGFLDGRHPKGAEHA